MRCAAQLDDRSRQVAGKPEAEQPADEEDRQKTSRDHPQTKGKRSRFSEPRRRARKIRLWQHARQNISSTLPSADQVSSKRTRLLRQKIEYVWVVFRNAADRVRNTFGNRSTGDFIPKIVEEHGVDVRRMLNPFQI